MKIIVFIDSTIIYWVTNENNFLKNGFRKTLQLQLYDSRSISKYNVYINP